MIRLPPKQKCPLVIERLCNSSTQALKHSNTQALKHSGTQALKHFFFFTLRPFSGKVMQIANNTKITLTGDLGSGKSAVSKILCEKTGFEYVSTGRIQRQLAQKMGIDTLEMNRRADIDPTIDEQIDSIFVALGQDPKGYVVDSRMAWFFLPDSFKVFLQTDVAVAALRIIHDPARDSEQYGSPEEAAQKILARKSSENARFLLKYGADSTNLNNFDIVIDTTHRTREEVAALVLAGVSAKGKGENFGKFW